MSDLLLSTFIARREALQQVAGHRPRDRRPALVRGDDADGRVRAQQPSALHLARPVTTTRRRRSSPGRRREPAARAAARRLGAARPVDRRGVARAGDRPRARAARGGRPGRDRRRARRAWRRGLRRLGGSGHPGRREHRSRRPGGHVPPDRELPRLPRRDHRHGADEPRGHAGAQVQRPDGDAVPRAVARAWQRAPPRAAGRGARDRRAHRAARDRGRVPPPSGRRALGLRGTERVLCSRAARGAALRRLAGRRRRRRQLRRPGRRLAAPRRRARDAAPSPRRPTRDDVGLPGAGARALRRRSARPQRGRRAARRRRPARSRHAEDRRAPAVLVPLPLPRRAALHRVARRHRRPRRARLRPHRADADGGLPLETNVPRIFAAGDVRSGSTKRCAAAVGEGAMAVQLVHGRLAG